jgi:SAM-dependent methyltransferase
MIGAALRWLAGPNASVGSLRPLFDGSLKRKFDRSARILDVGCGSGALLRELRDVGFRSLTGADPFVGASVEEPGLRIVKGGLESVAGDFDIVMFHHSLEHIPDPEAVLGQLAPRLAPDAIAVVRLPLGASFGWRTLGGNWAQLDPPRHLYLFSADGFERLARRAGLKLLRTNFDSVGDFFVWSEMRRMGLSEHKIKNGRSLFSREKLAEFDRQARALNATGEADQATFFLSRA